MNSITKLSQPVRRRLKKIVQFNKNANYRRRCKAILLLQRGHTKTPAELFYALAE